MIEPKEKYVFTFAQTTDGEDLKHRFMLTLSKPLSDDKIKAGMQSILSPQNGIDSYGAGGQFTLEVVIARTFDADEVIEVIKKELDRILSDIIQPSIVTP